MAKSIDSQLDQELQCSICYETFREPRMLPCQHTFCLKCLESVSKLNNNGKTIECSLCRRNHDLPRENGVKALPKNILLQSLLDMKKTRGTASLVGSESTKTGMDYSLEDMIMDKLEILLDIKSFANASPPSEDEIKKIADETSKFESILDGMERRAKTSSPSGTPLDSTKVKSNEKDEMKKIIDEMSLMESLLEKRANASPSPEVEMIRSVLDKMKKRANASLTGISLEEKNSNSIKAQFKVNEDRKKIPIKNNGEVFIEIRNSNAPRNAPTSMTLSQKQVLFTWSYCIAFAGIAIAMIVIGNHYGQKVNGFHLFITTSLQIEGASFLLGSNISNDLSVETKWSVSISKNSEEIGNAFLQIRENGFMALFLHFCFFCPFDIA